MKKYRISVWLLTLLVVACSGDDGTDGTAGAPGASAVDTGSIAGIVVDATGTPVSGATVDTTPATVVHSTGADGRFTFTSVPVGAYTISANATGYNPGQFVAGVAGGQTTNVSLTLVPISTGTAGRIDGQVLDVTGLGIADVTVRVEGQAAVTQTATDGSFALDNLQPGMLFLTAESPTTEYLDSETRQALLVTGEAPISDIEITLSGRPGDAARYVGSRICLACHSLFPNGPELAAAFDGSADSAAHSRFVVLGTDQMIYPQMWPDPGEALLPRSPSGSLLMVEDPQDGNGLVNVVLCTRTNASDERDYLFKFYEQIGPDDAPVSRVASDLDCTGADGDIVAWKALQDAGTYDPAAAPMFIQVAATIGGQGNWGEGWRDPDHALPDRHPNFGEGKQRYMCRVQDAPVLRQWAMTNDVSNWLNEDYVDFVSYMPVYLIQDGTPQFSPVLAPSDVGTPKFWKKSPTHWIYPLNTLSRNCGGCHATGTNLVRADFDDYTQVVVDWEFVDMNVGCEKCHGPGSDHAFTTDATRIISPQHLTAKSADETCGQCHGQHGGKSERPFGVHKYAYDADFESALGNGFFVPGVYDLDTFAYRLDVPVSTVADNWREGAFHSWPDETHSRAHSQMLTETRRSVHSNNSVEKVTCFSCHDAHSLDGGPMDRAESGFAFQQAAYDNNALCLSCHASRGDFAEVTELDVAVLQSDAGRGATLDGDPILLSTSDTNLGRNRVGRAVAQHMQLRAGMGVAIYTPTDKDSPVGNCNSCHMAKIGKLKDVDDDAQFKLKLDSTGRSAVAEGNVPSHVFDVVWPAQSAVLAPLATRDHEIMPNSCGNCHASARISGDSD